LRAARDCGLRVAGGLHAVVQLVEEAELLPRDADPSAVRIAVRELVDRERRAHHQCEADEGALRGIVSFHLLLKWAGWGGR
jgi:hypothetical protein